MPTDTKIKGQTREEKREERKREKEGRKKTNDAARGQAMAHRGLCSSMSPGRAFNQGR